MLNNFELQSKKEIAMEGSMTNLRLRFVISGGLMRREDRVIFFIGC